MPRSRAGPFPRAAWAVGGALFLLQWQSAASAQSMGIAQCQRLVPGTLACNQQPADHAPPNTERAAPSEPPSDAAINRLIEARAAVPTVPPSRVLQLADTEQQAHFASGSDQLTPLAIAQLDALVQSLRASQLRKVLVTAHTDSQRLVREAKRR